MNNSTTYDENEKIKKSLERYIKFSKTRNHEDVPMNITYTTLTSRFKDLEGEISTLLGNEICINIMKPSTVYNLKLNSGIRKQFSIESKRMMTPFLMNVIIKKGVGYGRILLSQTALRPTITNCDRIINLTSKFISEKYNRNAERVFSYENIYITIEAYKNIVLIIECTFGTGKKLLIIGILKITSKKEIKSKNKKKLKEFDDSEFSDSDIIKTNKQIYNSQKTQKFVRTLNWRNYCLKKNRVNISKNKIERADLQKKFVNLYKKIIIQKYEKIFKDKICKQKQVNEVLREFITMLLMVKLSKNIIDKYYVIF